jgi:hypothetical protein
MVRHNPVVEHEQAAGCNVTGRAAHRAQMEAIAEQATQIVEILVGEVVERARGEALHRDSV